MVTVQAPVPLHHAPPQPPKTPLPLVLTVRVTIVPVANAALQLLLQLMPAGLLVMTPRLAAAPVVETPSVKVCTCGFDTVNVSAFDALLPGLIVVTCGVPAAAMSLAGMAAVT